VPRRPAPRGLDLRDAPDRVPEPDGVLMTQRVAAPQPAFASGIRLTQKAHDAAAGALVANLPVAEALARKQVSPADRTHRHRAWILGLAPDSGYAS
jgi:hypothetical protein